MLSQLFYNIIAYKTIAIVPKVIVLTKTFDALILDSGAYNRILKSQLTSYSKQLTVRIFSFNSKQTNEKQKYPRFILQTLSAWNSELLLLLSSSKKSHTFGYTQKWSFTFCRFLFSCSILFMCVVCSCVR